MVNWLAEQELPADFMFVMFVVSVGWIVGGICQVLFPERMMEFNRKFVPKKSWDLAVRFRLASSSPKVWRVVGYIGIVAGSAGLVIISIWFAMRLNA